MNTTISDKICIGVDTDEEVPIMYFPVKGKCMEYAYIPNHGKDTYYRGEDESVTPEIRLGWINTFRMRCTLLPVD